jgi:hypothetical protein
VGGLNKDLDVLWRHFVGDPQQCTVFRTPAVAEAQPAFPFSSKENH